MDPKKAKREDGIPVQFFKACPSGMARLIVSCLTWVFVRPLPVPWKRAIVTPVQKSLRVLHWQIFILFLFCLLCLSSLRELFMINWWLILIILICYPFLTLDFNLGTLHKMFWYVWLSHGGRLLHVRALYLLAKHLAALITGSYSTSEAQILWSCWLILLLVCYCC